MDAIEAVEAGAGETGGEPMSTEQQAEARAYNHQKLLCSLTDIGLDIVFLAIMTVWVARPLDAWLEVRLPGAALRLLAMYAIVFALHLAISFPLSCYAEFSLEHKYQLSNQTGWRWLKRFAGRNALVALLTALIVVGLFEIIWHFGPWWWLLAAGVFFVISVIFGQLFPIFLLPLFYKVEPLDQPELIARLQRLAAGTGLTLAGVFRLGLSVETTKANAMLTGLGRSRRVLLGDTLLDQFKPEEIEVIFAHEIGHHVYHHIPKMIAEGLLMSTLGFWLCDRAMMAWVHHFAPAVGRDALPVWALPAIMLLMTLFGTVLGPLQNAISRRRERQCDRYALDRTGLRDAYRSAFMKLARLNKADPHPHPLEVALLHSHPPIAERLAMADAVKNA